VIGGVEHHAPQTALLEDRLAGVCEGHSSAERDTQAVRESGVGDRPAEVGQLELEEHVEHDVAVGPLERRVAVGEPAVSVEERADRLPLAVPDSNLGDGL